jgi:DNA-binding NtrC family response regulator
MAMIAALRRLNPGLPVVIISGEQVPNWGTHKLLATAYLAKPFTAEALMLVVRRTLDGACPSAPCMSGA